MAHAAGNNHIRALLREPRRKNAWLVRRGIDFGGRDEAEIVIRSLPRLIFNTSMIPEKVKIMSVQKIEFNDSNFDAETNEGLCVVCFEEPTDHDCRKQAAIIEHAASRLAGSVKIGKCDVENCFGLAQRFRVTSIPTTIVFKDGKEVERLAGYRHEMTFVKHLREDLSQDT